MMDPREDDDLADRYTRDLQTSFEEALLTGDSGLLVIWADGDYSMKPSSDVPFGIVREEWAPGDPSFA